MRPNASFIAATRRTALNTWRLLLALLTLVTLTTPAAAQNWSFDAREIALGGAGNGGDIAAAMIEEEQSYRAIVLPFGLLQVVPNWHVFDPGDDRFDPVRAGEYAAAPIHFIAGRDGTGSGELFVNDVRNATLNRDLNVYGGFVPARTLQEAGLAAPTWGKTFKFARRDDGAFQGIFVGAGPYFSVQTTTVSNDELRAVLGSDAAVYVPNTSLRIDDQTRTQMALSIVGGYRGRFALPGWTNPKDGLYVAANYRFLRGFLYEDFDFGLRLDTDNVGLLAVNQETLPVDIARDRSSSGRGYAIDIGIGAVLDKLEFGFGANGIGNRIVWKDADHRRYTIADLTNGGEFEESIPQAIPDLRVELPVDYRGHAAYRSTTWGATVEAGRSIQGKMLRGGVERSLGSVTVRGGVRYVRQRWEPRGGVGFDFSPHVGLDVTAFSTSANLERKRQLSIATSFRLMK